MIFMTTSTSISFVAKKGNVGINMQVQYWYSVLVSLRVFADAGTDKPEFFQFEIRCGESLEEELEELAAI